MKNRNHQIPMEIAYSNSLPAEIWQKILDMVPTHLLLQCLLVNKQWNQTTKARFYNFILIDSKIKYDPFIFNKDPNKLQSLENRLLVEKLCYKYTAEDSMASPADGTHLTEIFPNLRQVCGLAQENWWKNNKTCECLIDNTHKCCYPLAIIPYLELLNIQRELIYGYLSFMYRHRSTLSTIVFYNNNRRPPIGSNILYNNPPLQELGLMNYIKEFPRLKALRISEDAFDCIQDMLPIFEGCKNLDVLYLDKRFRNQKQDSDFTRRRHVGLQQWDDFGDMMATVPSVTKLYGAIESTKKLSWFLFAATQLFPNIRELRITDCHYALYFWKDMDMLTLDKILELSYSLDVFELLFVNFLGSPQKEEGAEEIVNLRKMIRTHFMMDTTIKGIEIIGKILLFETDITKLMNDMSQLTCLKQKPISNSTLECLPTILESLLVINEISELQIMKRLGSSIRLEMNT